ncbi:MAG: hypothetical protein COB02_00690 [Candidatus Cloacimonadota bacterium]|nr:MAG: hypothetical protein COB02_00690 [Candidatus Cloacimonadota bacterium]
MKNVLIIVSHPKKDSLTMAMAHQFKKLSEGSGNNIEFIDLYKTKHQQSFFSFENTNSTDITPEVEYFQNAISKADEIAFFFPYWWGSFPAILKNFFDCNFSKGFAFKYVNSMPKGLLTNKKVKIFTTTGAPKFFYTLTGANSRLKNMIKKQIVEFCGMKLDSCNIYGSVNTKNKNITKILNDIKNKV